jgi:hypothetical protein
MNPRRFSVILAYLDETGNTGMDLSDATGQPYHWVGALLVPQDAWHSSKAAVEQIHAFASAKGFVGADCELHGAEILHGLKNWRAVSLTDRLQIFEMCVSVMETHALKLVSGGCNKKLLRERYSNPDHPHRIATWLCLERVARYAKARNDLAVLVADECSPDHKSLSRGALKSYRQFGAPFGPSIDLSCLLDTIHYMSSAESPHIQLCDIALFIRQRYDRKGDVRIRDLYHRCNRLYAVSSGVIPY